MDWSNLMVERCPKCHLKLIKEISIWRCSGADRVPSCRFMIGAEKMKDMVKRMYELERKGSN